MQRMKSPLEDRRGKALHDLKKSPEVTVLRQQIAELHRQLSDILDPATKELTQVPRDVRTEFIPLKDTHYVSWEIQALREDGVVDQPQRRILLYKSLLGGIYRYNPAGFGHQFISPDMESAISLMRQELADGGWIFVGAELVGDNVRITDWRELA